MQRARRDGGSELNFFQLSVEILLARWGGLVIGLGGMETQARRARQASRKREGQVKEEVKKRGTKPTKAEIKEQVWLDLAHPRHLRTTLDWDSLEDEIGVGMTYLREVLARRRNGSLPLLGKIAYHMGKNEAARKKIFRLLTGAVEPK